MIIEVDRDADAGAVAALCDSLATGDDVAAWPVSVGGRRFVAVSGDESRVPDVDAAVVVGRHSTNARGYWFVDRANGVVPSAVHVGATPVGRGPLWCAAGPCALESFDDAVATGLAVRQQGAHALRIGIFKPRTSPYNFQGKQGPGVKLLPELKAAVAGLVHALGGNVGLDEQPVDTKGGSGQRDPGDRVDTARAVAGVEYDRQVGAFPRGKHRAEVGHEPQ